ncbi:MAG: hypothetical protein GF381_01120 [Candidatus Pacebacteria bacterium]|nr:hypothetical protein [Candidatus Paceibacterota bacterium]
MSNPDSILPTHPEAGLSLDTEEKGVRLRERYQLLYTIYKIFDYLQANQLKNDFVREFVNNPRFKKIEFEQQLDRIKNWLKENMPGEDELGRLLQRVEEWETEVQQFL